MTSESAASGVGLFHLLRQRGTGVLATQVAGLGLAFGVQVLLTRISGPAEYGLYAYVVTWCTLLAALSKLGFDNSILRFWPLYAAEKDYGKLKGFLQRTAQACTAVTLVAVAVMVSYGHWRAKSSGQDMFVAFLIGAAAVPVFVLVQLRTAILRANLHSVASQIPLNITRPLLIAAGALGLYQLARTPKVPEQLVRGTELLGVYLVATLLIAMWTWRVSSRTVEPSVAAAKPVYETRDWLRVSGSLMVLSLMLQVLNELDIVMVGTLLDTRSAGIYAVAARLSTLVVFALNAVNIVLPPVISRLYKAGDIGALQSLVHKAGLVLLAFSVPSTLGLMLFGKPLLSFFGPEFAEGYVCLSILVVGQLFNSLSGPVGYLMTMTGHHKQASISVGLAVATGALLNVVLIPKFGIEGAAVATVVTMVLWNLLLVIAIRRSLGINTFGFLRVGMAAPAKLAG